MKRWPPVSAVAGYFPDLPRREVPKPAAPPAPKDLPTCRHVKDYAPLDVPAGVGRLVFEGEADRDPHGNRRVRVRCAIEHGGCGHVFTMLARYYAEGACRGHCGCLGHGAPHQAVDRMLTLDGRALPLVAHVRAAMQRGVRIDFSAVRRRIVDGMSPERAVTTPLRRWGA